MKSKFASTLLCLIACINLGAPLSAQLGAGRPAKWIGEPNSTADYGGGETTHALIWSEIDRFSSGDYWDDYLAISRDSGINWTTNDIGGGYSWNGIPGDPWHRTIKISNNQVWVGTVSYESFLGPDSYIQVLTNGALVPRKPLYGDHLFDFDVNGDHILAITAPAHGATGQLFAHTSTDGGHNWNPPAMLVTSLSNELYSQASKALVTNDGTFCVAWMPWEYTNKNSVFFSSADASNSWSWPTRVDGHTTRNTTLQPSHFQFVETQGGLHISFWEEDPGTGDGHIRIASSWDEGAQWTENVVTDPGSQISSFQAGGDTDSANVVAAWIETDAGQESVRVSSSSDDGVSFSDSLTIPGIRINEQGEFLPPFVSASNGRLILGYASNGDSDFEDSRHAHHAVSVDGGQTWLGPYRVSGNTIHKAIVHWSAGEDHLVVIGQTDGDDARASGIRYPMINAKADGQGTLGLILKGAIPRPGTPAIARWAISTSIGQTVHPDNPELSLGLGASSELNYTLNHGPKFSSRILANGSAHCVAQIPPVAGTFYVQAWVNYGAVSGTGGTRPSDVLVMTL